ncbi:MAG: cysteine--tRNA ligase [Solirubrobacterales bacterium]|nr:cysteine--tRNA ligase [Solirubrobacterales bacterium]
MRQIRLHDTRAGEVQPLRPRVAGRVGIYACGPTVYSRIHIGNARPFVTFALLARFLAHEGLAVTLVVNITDVNDKIYDAARAGGVPSAELATEMTRAYIEDTDALGLGRPDHEPLASQMMEPIVAHIQALIDSGHAYEASGDVFFRVRSDPGYGSLSHRRVDDMDQGEGVEGAERKHDPLDFALWKARKGSEDTWWRSPWGEGRPGWHIECSAMAEALLGVGFEIHGGGSDLVFPHHENEAAQTRAARGAELAQLWVHNGMVQATGEKMAKSVGNIAPLHEVISRWGRDAVVMYLVSGHYRQPLAFSPAELEDAQRRVHRIRDAMRRLRAGAPSPADMAHHRDTFLEALADDFNTPRALAALFEWIREANRRTEAGDRRAGGDGAGGDEAGGDGAGGDEAGGDGAGGDEAVGDRRGGGDEHLREMLGLLGLEALTPLSAAGEGGGVDPRAAQLLQERERARAAREFERADRLREEIRAMRWEVRDGPHGPELIPLAPRQRQRQQ